MRIPTATYRIQINPNFGFRDTAGLDDYLSSLGISHVYAGPIFKARRGSQHGYDIVDPNSLNPELGSEADFADLMEKLKQSGLAWIQDIVPNHMALDSANAMLMDVLENYTDSEFYTYFDIDWTYHPTTPEARLTLPFLARPYHECMKEGEIRLVIDGDGMAVVYEDLRLPLKLTTYWDVLRVCMTGIDRAEAPPGIRHLIDLFDNLVEQPGPGPSVRAKARVLDLHESDAAARDCLDRAIETINSSHGDLSGTGVLDGLLDKQVFRLVHWKSGSAEINYRRFFNVSRLICLRMEIPAVFEHHHRLVAEWLAGGLIAGVRVDHVDGLYDAHGYLSRLRAMAPDAYLVVEKILSSEEALSPHWDIEGTTGYDFLNMVNGIFCKQSNADSFEDIYRDFTGLTDTYSDLVYENRRTIVETHFQAALERLARAAEELCEAVPGLSPSGRDGLKQALTGLVACFPVYRTYIGPRPPHPADRSRVEEAVEEAERRDPEAGHDLDVLKSLILAPAEDLEDSDLARGRLRFVRALQQYTGPIMAKGFEDTVLYVYNRLISLNEVGGEPQTFGVDLEDFHRFNHARRAEWPHSMSATSTHDAKRGEDVRARLNVISEMPLEFGQRIWKWRDLNAGHATSLEGVRVPSHNDEYFLYQTLLGAFPFEQEERAGFAPRLEAYMVKAMREGKSLTSWGDPDTAYENGFVNFMKTILNSEVSREFLSDFMEFARKVHRYGVYNSLSQTLLKITAPGVPDFYQGAEVWDLNLVDPDNRRPVDFVRRARLLRTLADGIETDLRRLLRDLLAHPEDGAVKLFLIQQALAVRNGMPDLFTRGEYIPLYSKGSLKEHLICFARKLGDRTVLAIAPRFPASLVESDRLPLGQGVWRDTEIPPPEGFPTRWKDAITGNEITSAPGLKIGGILTHFPVALLLGLD